MIDDYYNGRGLKVRSVWDNSPAKCAGISPGQYLYQVENREVKNSEDAYKLLDNRSKEKVNVVIVDNNGKKSILILDKMTPEKPYQCKSNYDGKDIALFVTQDTPKIYSDSPSSSNTTSDIKAPIVALTVAKKNIPITALVVKQENIQKDDVKLSDRWEKAGTTLNGLQLFIDNNTMSRPSEDIVRVWVKTIANTDNCTDLLEIDCVQLKIKKIDSQKESLAFPEQTNEWKFIVPETASELIFNSVCLK